MRQKHKNTRPITQNKLKQLKPTFGCLLRPLTWKHSGPILKGKGK